MKKLTLLLISFFQLVAFTPDVTKSFEEKVQDAYDEYSIVTNISNQYYEFRVVKGINNDQLAYGVSLYNYDANSHKIMIIINSKEYTLKKDNRGDYNHPAIKFNSDNVIINVVDDKNSVRQSCTLELESIDNFKNNSTNLTGENKGISYSSLKRNVEISSVTILIIVFSSIIVICIAILVILAITKKGMFNVEKRKKDVFNFKEFVNNYNNINKDNFETPTVFVDSKVDDINKENSVEDLKEKEVYKRTHYYDDDDENEVDVENMLMLKGYNINYDIATVDEKNKIMLELMRMRDFKEITLTQYQNEVIKLWK